MTKPTYIDTPNKAPHWRGNDNASLNRPPVPVAFPSPITGDSRIWALTMAETWALELKTRLDALGLYEEWSGTMLLLVDKLREDRRMIG